MKLSPRSTRVLEITVRLYLQTAQAVPSVLVSKHMKKQRLSPATIRSEMALLESIGLLTQPHISSGRLPTAHGLRIYINQTLKPRLHPKDRHALDQIVAQTPPNQLAVELGKRIAELSKQMTAVLVPQLLLQSLREFGLVRIDEGRFLVYLISTGGVVQQRMIEMEFDLSRAEVTHIQNYLNTKLARLSLTEIRELLAKELAADQKQMNRLERSALEIGRKALDSQNRSDLTIDGTSHLCDHPEFAKTANLQQLLKAIESKTALVDLLNQILNEDDVTIILSSEHGIRELPTLSCVGRVLKTSRAGESAASISVLGPARMDYSRLVPMVNYASELLEHHWLGV